MNQRSPSAYIPAGMPFLPTLAAWVLEQFGRQPEDLTKLLILLPNRRSCRSLREAFLACSGGKPLLLPRLQPMGEVGEDAFWLAPESLPQLPPPMPELRRHLLLTSQVHAAQRDGRTASLEQSARLAQALARLQDEAMREGVSLDHLEALVPQELSRHWELTTECLKLITHRWPQQLEALGCVDAAHHRTLRLKQAAAAWRAHPPQHPVIAAGLAAHIPAFTPLLASIAAMPQGWLVIPGPDMAMSPSQWDTLEETHPQYGIKTLLSALSLNRAQLAPLVEASFSARTQCINAVLAPPAATAHWPQQPLPLEEGLSGLRVATLETQHDEARAIAALLRETLETPHRTAALVTPDRQLARMVAAQMQRFGIAIDDSGGIPLSHTPTACYLRLLLAMLTSQVSPAALLALARHPLAAFGTDPAACRRAARQWERCLLRGVRPAPGFAPLLELSEKELAEGKNGYLEASHLLLKALAARCEPLMQEMHSPESASLSHWLKAHLALAESLAQTPDQEGAQRLWAGDEGSELAQFLAQLVEHAGDLPAVPAGDYPALLDLWLSGQPFRPRYGSHPRLHIFGPMEARLQSFDRVILGGMNEGIWPAPPAADPWLSRPMRASLGLPAAEASIGQAAHDAAMLLCQSNEVILTRAQKVEGSPSLPSRWLVRLFTLLEGQDKAALARITEQKDIHAMLACLDTPAALPPMSRPSACPPLSARPVRASVSGIDLWNEDPYAFYARYVLGLRALDPLDQPAGAADFGNLVHAALEAFTKAYPRELPPDAATQLLERGHDAFAQWLKRPALEATWWPRFVAMVPPLLELEQQRRIPGVQCFAEVKGKWAFQAGQGAFTLDGRADRLEFREGGALAIVDYKTGTPPSKKSVHTGKKSQLPLLGLIAINGQLEGAPAALSIAALEYWKLSANPPECNDTDVTLKGTGKNQSTIDLLTPARQRLEALIAQYQSPQVSYDAALYNDNRNNDYEHLTRREEWEVI